MTTILVRVPWSGSVAQSLAPPKPREVHHFFGETRKTLWEKRRVGRQFPFDSTWLCLTPFDSILFWFCLTHSLKVEGLQPDVVISTLFFQWHGHLHLNLKIDLFLGSLLVAKQLHSYSSGYTCHTAPVELQSFGHLSSYAQASDQLPVVLSQPFTGRIHQLRKSFIHQSISSIFPHSPRNPTFLKHVVALWLAPVRFRRACPQLRQ